MAVEKIAALVADPPSPGPAARDAARLVLVVGGPEVAELFTVLKGMPGMQAITCAGCGKQGVTRETAADGSALAICPECQEKGRAGGTV